MSWPLSQDYNEAIQDPRHSFADVELKTGEAVANALGIPLPCSGNFADVYQVRCPSGARWAVKCFTREVHGLRERYHEISKYLRQVNLPFMVDFQYLEQGIRVRGRWYPILKMHWVEGFTLNAFVRDNLDKPVLLEKLSRIWLKMAQRLRESHLGHCDLQHGNILLVPGGGGASLAVKLIDYDGMWVPALAPTTSGEVGHPAYQHPQRLRDSVYSLEVDRFSLLVIATALRGLSVGGRALWERYDNGDNLLFRAYDFEAPGRSPLFADLLRMKQPGMRDLAVTLIDAARLPLDQVPHLADLAPEEKPATSAIPRSKSSSASRTVAAVPSEPNAFQDLEPEPAIRDGGGSLISWIAAGSVAACALLGGVLLWALHSRGQPEQTSLRPESPQARADNVVPAKNVADKNTPQPVDKSQADDPPPLPPDKDENKQPKPAPASKPDDPVGEVHIFKGHTAIVRRVAFSPDGRHVLSAGHDNTARVWETATGRELLAFKGHTNHEVHSAAFLPDGRRALSSGDDNFLRLWDVSDGREIRRFEGHGAPVHHLAVSPDGRRALSCHPTKGVILWNLETGAILYRLAKDPEGAECVSFSADGRWGLSGEKAISLWDLQSGRWVRAFKGHTAGVKSVAFSFDGRFVLSGSDDKTIRLWDTETGKEMQRFERHTDAVWGVAFAPDGRRVISASLDRSVRLWDTETGKELERFERHTAGVTAIAFSLDGRYALSGSIDRTLRLWRLPFAPLVAGQPLQVVPKPSLIAVKLPLPDKATQDKATEDIRYIYKSDYDTSRRPDDRVALAGKLLKRGMNNQEEVERRFVYLREARDLAARGGDFTLSLRAIDEMAAAFAVETLPMKTAALELAAKAIRDPDAANTLLGQALTAIDEAEASDDYEQELKLLRIAQSAALKSGDYYLPGVITQRQTRLNRLRAEYAKIVDAVKTLADKPGEAEANRIVGTFQCFDKEDWSKGLPMLARSGDATLAELARQDMGKPTGAAEQAALGRAWWTFADMRSEAGVKSSARQRAKHWFYIALPSLKGVEADRISALLEVKKGKFKFRPGLVAELFDGENFEKKVKTRLDYQIDYDWDLRAPDAGLPADHFSIRWQGFLIPPRAGVYKLILRHDDDFHLKLDGKTVIDKWGKGGSEATTAEVALSAQPHVLQLDYREITGKAVLQLQWSLRGGFTKQAVPLEALYHETTQERLLKP